MKVPGDEYGSDMTAKHTDTNQMSKEEKIKLRQLKIAQWKAKKELEQALRESTPKTDPSSKIEEWKKRRIQQDVKGLVKPLTSSFGPGKKAIRISAFLKAEKLVKSPSIVVKRSIFGDEDEEVPTTKKKLKLGNNGEPVALENEDVSKNGESEEELSLDDFMTKLAETESQRKNIIENHESDSEADLDVDLKTNGDIEQLISSKIEKLQQTGKVLEAVDHDVQEYKPFKKQFYVELLELASMREEDVETTRLLLGGISVKGHSCPKPVLEWSQLGLPLVLLDVLTTVLGYKEPSPIQCQALPVIMSGRDFIGIAKTGSGKTLLFVLPMIRHIQGQETGPQGDGPVALILAPTRELSLQIFKEVSVFTKKLDLRACCCYGGAPIQNQIADLKRGVDVMVGTPGRVIDLLAANSGRVTNLQRTTFVVLDEADRMFDMGFEPQVNKIFNQVRPDRQTVLFLATFPKKMDFLAKKVLVNAIEVVVGGRSVVAAEITQSIELLESDKKFDRLLAILLDPEIDTLKSLIFVEKQTDADDLLVRLVRQGFQCQAIHGGKDQLDRKHLVKQFTSGEIQILIATSVASRGLDVKGLNLVINYDAPSHMEDYVHRVGRTGRAGATGRAITFVQRDQERAISDIVKAMRLANAPEAGIPQEVLSIAELFQKKVKEGTTKISSGFGGKGLDKLQEIRETKQDLERRAYGENSGDPNTPNLGSKPKIKTSTSNTTSSSIQFPEWKISEGGAPETTGPDQGKFHSRIAVNDLPQLARWILISRENIAQVIDSTGTSITSKGQYYPPGKAVPKPTKKNGREIQPPPKLYLLVEGQTEAEVEKAITLLKEKMIEGLDQAKEDGRGPTGRYVV